MKKVIIYFSVMAASCMLGSCSDLAFGDGCQLYVGLLQ